jgi:hypothetical protein
MHNEILANYQWMYQYLWLLLPAAVLVIILAIKADKFEKKYYQ